MGVTVSSESTLAPVSLASTIIGFASFAVTVATLIKVFWDNVQTIFGAPTEITDMLGNLKAGLYEERRHLRRVCKSRSKSRRRRSRSNGRHVEKDGSRHLSREEVGDRTLMLLRSTIRHMMSNFRTLERPFLAYEAQQKRSASRKLRDAEWDMDEVSMRHDDGSDGDSYGQTEYRKCGLRERIIWLRTKYKIKDLMDALQRIQTRRIAKELGDLFMYVSSLAVRWCFTDFAGL